MRFRDAYREPDPFVHADGLPPRAPWEQLPHEPPEAFALFVRYLTHPSGSVPGFVRAEGLIPGTTFTHAARWRWVARRAAYDGAIVQAGAQAAQESARDLAREHARILSSARQLLADSLSAALSKNQVVDLDKVPAWLKNIVELERLVAGEATSRAAIDLSGASPEALSGLDAALRALEAAPEPSPAEPSDGLN